MSLWSFSSSCISCASTLNGKNGAEAGDRPPWLRALSIPAELRFSSQHPHQDCSQLSATPSRQSFAPFQPQQSPTCMCTHAHTHTLITERIISFILCNSYSKFCWSFGNFNFPDSAVIKIKNIVKLLSCFRLYYCGLRVVWRQLLSLYQPHPHCTSKRESRVITPAALGVDQQLEFEIMLTQTTICPKVIFSGYLKNW